MSIQYWRECIEASAQECGLSLTDEQAAHLAAGMEHAHEMYGQAHGHDVIGNPVEVQAERELRELRDRIKAEEDWEARTAPCTDCNTTGQVNDGWGRPQSCRRCDGKGRVSK